ncbi:hypothetical protein HZS_3160 [Henneguya salminicola]|nr:hypothetical protein HZS_3160 [Henneguya salminicola]
MLINKIDQMELKIFGNKNQTVKKPTLIVESPENISIPGLEEIERELSGFNNQIVKKARLIKPTIMDDHQKYCPIFLINDLNCLFSYVGKI